MPVRACPILSYVILSRSNKSCSIYPFKMGVFCSGTSFNKITANSNQRKDKTRYTHASTYRFQLLQETLLPENLAERKTRKVSEHGGRACVLIVSDFPGVQYIISSQSPAQLNETAPTLYWIIRGLHGINSDNILKSFYRTASFPRKAHRDFLSTCGEF